MVSSVTNAVLIAQVFVYFGYPTTGPRFLAPMAAVEDMVATLACTTFVDPREGKYATPVWAQSGGDLRARFTPKKAGRRPATRAARHAIRLTTFPGAGNARRPAKNQSRYRQDIAGIHWYSVAARYRTTESAVRESSITLHSSPVASMTDGPMRSMRSIDMTHQLPVAHRGQRRKLAPLGQPVVGRARRRRGEDQLADCATPPPRA